METAHPEASDGVVRTDVVIVGAGPAGLAAAACLVREGIRHEIIDRADSVGASWRGHYERLHLHTARKYSGLPYLPMPSDYPTYPSRQQVVDYLEGYAEHSRIKPRLGEEVTAASPLQGGGWQVQTDKGRYLSTFVVAASGYNGRPNRPDLPGLADFGGPVQHSSEYSNGARFSGQSVLVVGCGNSGAEIAIDLVEHGAAPCMVVRGPSHVVPRDVLGRPTQASTIMLSFLPAWLADFLTLPLLALVVGDLSKYGIVRPTLGPRAQVEQLGRVAMLDIGTIEHIKQGRIQVVPGVRSFGPGRAEFADGSSREFAAVVLATGFRPSFGAWLVGAEDVVTERGYPTGHGVQVRPGLYFTGFANPPTGAIREMGIEARRIARAIAAALRS